ncbi:Glycosyltransferase type 1 [Halomicronema hongdechloris C2206]|uniref:Glycosyltransferase type 1 n=1 Tax=Halomicronema hongdechloris C2206 TaxID=1641165 RepID=A0A1Z3HSS8_9CYAN|nr:glycosyltransferase family 4 protein [Halomicronema hongdechloris]ASC73187.1 Glycosyltransferase type 1 [Halomicronema hongdechloris C2206]
MKAVSIQNIEQTDDVMASRSLDRHIHVMHIIDKLSVSGSGVHGVGRAIEWWIPRFDSNEFRFSICSLRTPEAAGKVFEEQGIPPFFLGRGKFDVRTVLDLVKLIKRERPHVLHLHGYGATNFGRIASFLTGTPNIVHEHTVIDNQPLYQTIVDTFLSPLTSKAIAISQPVYEFMIRHRKIDPAKLDVFFYGIPLSEFQAPEQREIQEKRSKLNIDPDEHVICNVGRLDTQKGQIYLLKAAILVLKELPNTRFLIVGEGPDREMLESFARENGISDRIIFTGLRKDVPTLLALSDLVAIPSLWEGGPLTLFEAMNLSKPVIGTPAGMMGEVISNGKTGFQVPLRSVDELAERIIYLLKNPTIAKRMGGRSWKVCQNYDISASVRRLSEIYRELFRT